MDEFEEIYRTYFADVYRYIRRLSGSDQIAEEITCETFFRAMSALGSFRGNCDIRVWLCQIGKNLYFDQKKSEKRTVPAETPELLTACSPENTPEESVLQKAEARQIRQILHEIKEPYKEVFMWRVYAELSFSQIGSLYGKSQNWACVTYHRARTMIRNRLEENNHEK